MNYYELRKQISKLIPRQKVLFQTEQKVKSAVKEKGRKLIIINSILKKENGLKMKGC